MAPNTDAMCVDEASLRLHTLLAWGKTKTERASEHCAKIVATLLAQPKAAKGIAYAGT